jgi:hypothetical protein
MDWTTTRRAARLFALHDELCVVRAALDAHTELLHLLATPEGRCTTADVQRVSQAMDELSLRAEILRDELVAVSRSQDDRESATGWTVAA